MYSARSYMSASHHSTLSHAFPVGLGTKLAAPDRAVVVLSGGGGFQYRVLGTRLHNPDFVALAKSYGATAVQADGAEELGSALPEALKGDVPTLIEVPVGEMGRVY